MRQDVVACGSVLCSAVVYNAMRRCVVLCRGAMVCGSVGSLQWLYGAWRWYTKMRSGVCDVLCRCGMQRCGAWRDAMVCSGVICCVEMHGAASLYAFMRGGV